MTLRIVLNAFGRTLYHSLTVDSHVIMTRKKTYINSEGLNRLMAARLCTESSVKVAQPNPCDQDCDSETGLLNSDSESDEIAQQETVKFLIVGLGNPECQRTRHSVGMRFVDRVASRLGASWTKEAFKKTGGFTASVELNSVEIHLLKPRVPMNLNGTSVIKAARFYSVVPENVYLIHDELDRPVGKFQLKEGGSASGHKGVKSVMNSLKSDVMPRLRIGIDRPSDTGDVVDYVLEKFPLDEYRVICGVIDESIQQMFDHMGNKCGIELDIKSKKYTRQDSDYDSHEELQFRFGKGSKYKYDESGSRYKDNKRDARYRNDRRDFKYRERRDFSHWDERNDFKFRRDRRDFRYKDNHRDIFDQEFKVATEDFEHNMDKENKKDVKPKQGNPVYFSDE